VNNLLRIFKQHRIMVKSKKADNSIRIKGLKKSYGELKVLDGVYFSVKRGEVLALLGPNGAGKTTTIRILSTLLLPDSGECFVDGHDVVKNPNKVKASIGLTGQYAAVDEYLTGRENLEMIGRLYRLSMKDIRKRTDELLELFDLKEAGKRIVKNYSGGMRRRIDLAMSLISSPPILFLDEPTTGLDPRSRLTLWEIIKQLAATDVTVLLTTQYMEEADNLADRIVVIDHGKVIAEGTPLELKSQIGAENIELIINEKSDFGKVAKSIKAKNMHIDDKRRSLRIPTTNGAEDLRRLLQQFEKSKIEIDSLSLDKPTLDDVFLTLTGKGVENE